MRLLKNRSSFFSSMMTTVAAAAIFWAPHAFATCVNSPSDAGGSLPVTTGKLVWHSYTSYGDGSSQLFVRDVAGGTTTNISSGWACASGCTARDPMNAVWNSDGTWLLFMAENGDQSAWNIWVAKADGTSLTNLTGSTGTTRNEDPKFTSDGSTVIWKQKQGTTYRIMSAPISFSGTPSLGTQTTVKSDATENSMPYVDSSFSNIYYSPLVSGTNTVSKQAVSSGVVTGSATQIDSNGYYPVVAWTSVNGLGANTVFWNDDVSQSGTDQIAYKAGGTGTTTYPSINDCNSNNSDPWPVGGTNYVFFSSTYPGSYELYLGDLSSGNRYNISSWYSDTTKSHLGSSYYSSGSGGGSSTTVNLTQTTGQTTNPTASASSYSTVGGVALVAAHAIDGNTADTNASRWDSTEPMPNPSWLIVDLGTQCASGYNGECTITGIDLYKDSYPTNTELDYSTDGTHWTTFWSSTTETSYSHDALNQSAIGGPLHARYIRAYGTTGAPYGMSLAEIQIWGCTAQTCN